jgi:hypothetical protein
MPRDGRPVRALAARVDSKQAGAIAPLECGAKLRKTAKCEWWGEGRPGVRAAPRDLHHDR